MKTYLDCIPCFFQQALRAGRMATDDEKKIKQLLDEIGIMLKDISLDSTPPETGRLLYEKVSEVTGNRDPYKKVKWESTEKALELYPSLKETVERSNDKLLTAIRLAIAGNVMDFGAYKDFNIEKEIEDALTKDFAICDYDEFRNALDKTDKILYLGDNAGETVFDKILIERMNKPVVYVVRETPVINDATYEDAVHAGIDKVASVISSGTNAPGCILNTCSAEFREILDSSRFIISKGQGNYEGLSNEKYQIFFLLKAKCRIIADNIGVSNGDIILKGINIKN